MQGFARTYFLYLLSESTSSRPPIIANLRYCSSLGGINFAIVLIVCFGMRGFWRPVSVKRLLTNVITKL